MGCGVPALQLAASSPQSAQRGGTGKRRGRPPGIATPTSQAAAADAQHNDADHSIKDTPEEEISEQQIAVSDLSTNGACGLTITFDANSQHPSKEDSFHSYFIGDSSRTIGTVTSRAKRVSRGTQTTSDKQASRPRWSDLEVGDVEDEAAGDDQVTQLQLLDEPAQEQQAPVKQQRQENRPSPGAKGRKQKTKPKRTERGRAADANVDHSNAGHDSHGCSEVSSGEAKRSVQHQEQHQLQHQVLHQVDGTRSTGPQRPSSGRKKQWKCTGEKTGNNFDKQNLGACAEAPVLLPLQIPEPLDLEEAKEQENKKLAAEFLSLLTEANKDVTLPEVSQEAFEAFPLQWLQYSQGEGVADWRTP